MNSVGIECLSDGFGYQLPRVVLKMALKWTLLLLLLFVVVLLLFHCVSGRKEVEGFYRDL